MKVEYNAEFDILNIEFIPDTKISESEEYEGIIIDYSKNRKIVSIEILDASQRTLKDPLQDLDLKVVRSNPVVSVT